jgi:hypothetical protein
MRGVGVLPPYTEKSPTFGLACVPMRRSQLCFECLRITVPALHVTVITRIG